MDIIQFKLKSDKNGGYFKRGPKFVSEIISLYWLITEDSHGISLGDFIQQCHNSLGFKQNISPYLYYIIYL